MAEKFLVLDVDETLLNIEPLFFLEKFKKNYRDYIGKLIFDKYYLSPRPGVDEFVREAKKYFKLIAFSVVSKEITIRKLKALNISDNFIKIYGKEDLQNGKKSLKKIADDLNVSMNDIIAIDDIPESFLEQEKIIKINPWFIGDNKKDNALMAVFKDLEPNTKILS